MTANNFKLSNNDNVLVLLSNTFMALSLSLSLNVLVICNYINNRNVISNVLTNGVRKTFLCLRSILSKKKRKQNVRKLKNSTKQKIDK